MAKAKAADEPALFEDGELPAVADNIAQAAQDAYNEAAKALPWRQSTSLTKARQAALRRAVQDFGGLAGFKAAIARAAKSPFLLGHTGRTGVYKNWRPTLAFFCQPKSIENLMDGVYDGEIEEVGPKKLHIPTQYQPPHLKPVEPFKTTETQEFRLEAMAASYHKVGRYKDEARVLEQLAKLTGRPFVMTPAPDVAGLTIPPKEPEPPRRPPPTVTTMEPDWEGDIPEGADYGSE